jgi:hypothetical protein
MSSEPSTLLSRLEKARAKCIRLAEEINHFLAENGRPTVSLIQADKLRFALMGQYNAGKSTLVNALLGETVAQVGDAPTTRQVHTYKFRDFHILDLPGSDARAGEQQEAERGRREAHLILYVVSSQTGLDYESFWKDLQDLLDSGQYWLLIVNDKQPHPDAASERSFREEVLSRFQERAREMVHLTEWSGRVFWINADRALRARRAKPPNQRLEEVSGIIPLENQLVELLSQNDEFLRNVPRLTDLQKALVDAEREWRSQLQSDESRRLSDALQRCETVEEKLSAAAAEIAQEYFSQLREALAGLLLRRLGDNDPDALTAEATDFYNVTCQSACEAFEKRCQAEFQTLVARLGGSAVPGKIVVDKELNLNLGSLPQISPSAGFDWDSLLEKLRVCFVIRQSLAEEAVPELVQIGTKEAAKQGSKQVAKIAAEQSTQSVTKDTLSKWGGRVVVSLIAVWELYQGYCKANEEDGKRQAAMREAENKAALAATNAREKFVGCACHSVSDTLAPLIRQLTEELRARGRQGGILEARLAQVGELRNQLQQVIAELNARGQE